LLTPPAVAVTFKARPSFVNSEIGTVTLRSRLPESVGILRVKV